MLLKQLDLIISQISIKNKLKIKNMLFHLFDINYYAKKVFRERAK